MTKLLWPEVVAKKEIDPTGKSPHEAGSKLDAGKAAPYQGLTRYFPRAMLEVARVSTYGAMKYTWNGWRSVEDGVNRYRDAGERHRFKAEVEGAYDLETTKHPISGGPMPPLRHRAQVCWNELAALELELEKEETEPWVSFVNCRSVPETGYTSTEIHLSPQ